MQVHGYEFTPIQDGQAYSVNLTDEVIVLSKQDGDRIAQDAKNADEVRDQARAAKAQNSEEWHAERDEDSARSESDERAMETAQNASSGESHQESARDSESNPGTGREA